MRYLFLCTLLVCLISCNKNKVKAGNSVDLYLLSSFRQVPGKCQIDVADATYTLQTQPLISNQDILQYSRDSYQYTLTSSATEKVKLLMGRTPFAITVDKKVIFFGFYMPPILSSSCDHSITMDVSWNQANSITMKLGYPGILAGVTIDDQRNNPVLIASFANQGKLK